MKIRNFLLLACIAFTLGSCAFVAAPVIGGLYTDVKAPLAATSNAVGTKVGTAKATSILGIVATGDASIAAAASNGGIRNISHVDYQAKSILGIFASFEVFVYGN